MNMKEKLNSLKRENEQLKDDLDALGMRYLSQTSLWMSNYKRMCTVSEDDLEKEKKRFEEMLLVDGIPRNGFDLETVMRAFEIGYRTAKTDKHSSKHYEKN